MRHPLFVFRQQKFLGREKSKNLEILTVVNWLNVNSSQVVSYRSESKEKHRYKLLEEQILNNIQA